MKRLITFLPLVAALTIIGCAKKPKPTRVMDATPIVESVTDTTPPPRTFIPREADSMPTQELPPRYFSEVYFSFDSDTLTEASSAALNRAAAFLSDHPGYALEISGYADTVGTEAYNADLSQRRADRAWVAITAIVSPHMGIAAGNGESDGPPELARRVTIRVLP